MLNKTVFLFILTLTPAFVWAGKFDCKDLSGSYECRGKNNHEIIEMNGQEITVIDDADLPISYKINGQKNEAASEKEHVSYTSNCRPSAIEIKKQVTPRNGGTISEQVTKFTFSKQGDLINQTLIQNKNLSARNDALCFRVETGAP